MRDYIGIATKYREDVLAGVIPACEWVKRSCERQKADVERAATGWIYEFNKKRATDICAFVEAMPHVEGKWAQAGEKIHLGPWQVLLYSTIFGWVHADSKQRRFRTVYLELPRKNSKTTMSAPVGLWMTGCDGEAGGKVFSAATTFKQASLVWNIARLMIQKEPGLQKHFGLGVSAHAIYHEASGSSFQPLSAEGNSLDGLNASCIIIDELHAHRNRRVYDVLETSKGARTQPLLWCITTAGSDRSGICYEVRTHVTKVLNRVVEDDSFFGVIYTIDDGMDPFAEDSWKVANPNYNVSVDPAEIRNLAVKARSTPAALATFMTKHLSCWVNADVGLFNIVNWTEKCFYPDLSLEDCAGQACIIGIDLAWKSDFSSMVFLFEGAFEDEPDRPKHYFVFARHYLASKAIELSDNAQLAGWVREGWIIETPGDTTDFRVIEEDLAAACESFQVTEIPHDMHQAVEFSTRMLDAGLPMVAMTNNSIVLTEPCDKLSAIIDEGRIHHSGDPVLTWHLSNVVGHRNRRNYVYPTKDRPENKIDGAMALLYALARSLRINNEPIINNSNPEQVAI